MRRIMIVVCDLSLSNIFCHIIFINGSMDLFVEVEIIWP
jgi:hypothetical protein